ncbi:hypothetical protein BCR33DRAFT_499900 [Rhizoclosmatium globosum]|uniref:Uncharacterized protein n=1 Tax=Rhizoclosmatium globosum TaxID=329046 RepID=A0A1Y2CVA0_9FUNG|nr:hypothetical protein BCR33DRAFT_499900 [Rhizoclosmatium globosum]|eukprot:ORY50980.1 hypothetical protein BCR33DRAFT_499900 [Rhizoclosmatium globosum]
MLVFLGVCFWRLVHGFLLDELRAWIEKGEEEDHRLQNMLDPVHDFLRRELGFRRGGRLNYVLRWCITAHSFVVFRSFVIACILHWRESLFEEIEFVGFLGRAGIILFVIVIGLVEARLVLTSSFGAPIATLF